jgi:hypothetical protein
MLFKLLNYFLFAGTMFFAAGASAVTDAGGSDVADAGSGGEADAGVGDLGYGDETTGGEEPAAEEAEAGKEEPIKTETEEPELQDFRGAVSARLRGLVKQSPKLAEAFKENPKLQEQIEATFRREAALRELFPTVAEARQMREQFPNGIADVQQILEEQKEVEQLDEHFYTRDSEGNYPGHQQIVQNMFNDDRQAALALFKSLPKQWANLDRDSYNEVMGQIVGATLAQRRLPEYLSSLIGVAKKAEQGQIADGLQEVLDWMQGFLAEKPRPTQEEERLTRERNQLNKQKFDLDRTESQRFHTSFVSNSRKLQQEIINNHPAMKKLAQVNTIKPEKRAQIVEAVRSRIEKFLGKSPSFMRQLRPAYDNRNLEEATKVQRAAWSQQWLLNRMVREVLRVETPAMVSNNREAARRRAGTPAPKTPAQTSGKQPPKGPHQVNGRWYKGDGSPYSTVEVLAGKHLQP